MDRFALEELSTQLDEDFAAHYEYLDYEDDIVELNLGHHFRESSYEPDFGESADWAGASVI